jgi:hypothetical protein
VQALQVHALQVQGTAAAVATARRFRDSVS